MSAPLSKELREKYNVRSILQIKKEGSEKIGKTRKEGISSNMERGDRKQHMSMWEGCRNRTTGTKKADMTLFNRSVPSPSGKTTKS